jgi:hypothetical protein
VTPSTCDETPMRTIAIEASMMRAPNLFLS